MVILHLLPCYGMQHLKLLPHSNPPWSAFHNGLDTFKVGLDILWINYKNPAIVLEYGMEDTIVLSCNKVLLFGNNRLQEHNNFIFLIYLRSAPVQIFRKERPSIPCG